MCVDCCLDEYYCMYQDLLAVSGTLFLLVDLAVTSKLIATAATNAAQQLACITICA